MCHQRQTEKIIYFEKRKKKNIRNISALSVTVCGQMWQKLNKHKFNMNIIYAIAVPTRTSHYSTVHRKMKPRVLKLSVQYRRRRHCGHRRRRRHHHHHQRISTSHLTDDILRVAGLSRMSIRYANSAMPSLSVWIYRLRHNECNIIVHDDYNQQSQNNNNNYNSASRKGAERRIRTNKRANKKTMNKNTTYIMWIEWKLFSLDSFFVTSLWYCFVAHVCILCGHWTY